MRSVTILVFFFNNNTSLHMFDIYFNWIVQNLQISLLEHYTVKQRKLSKKLITFRASRLMDLTGQIDPRLKNIQRPKIQ